MDKVLLLNFRRHLCKVSIHVYLPRFCLCVCIYKEDIWFSCDIIILQKKKKNPSKVLVSSDARPSNNLNFCNVSVRQGSSLRNRVRWNFKVCVNEKASSRAERCIAH